MVAASFTPLPEGISTMPPGAGLGAALATIDPARVAPKDTAVLLAATRRQLSHTEATHARVLRECALADPREPSGRREDYGTHSSGEPRTVLGESRTRIQNAMALADDAFVRLPAVGAAWAAGDLDTDRVRLLCHWTRALSEAHAAEVVEQVLPEALLKPGAGLILSALIERIAEVATALDPTWAARTYDTAAAQARVRARRTEAGTVNLSGLDLPLDDATRSTAHIATLAARAKAAGHPGGIDTIRARMYLLLLSPRTAGFDDDALIAHALTTADPAAASPLDPHADPGDPADAPPGSDEPEAGSDPADSCGADTHVRETDDETGEETDDDRAGDDDTGHDEAGDDEAAARGLRLPRQARIELRVALSTLLGLDDKPARMPGHGVLHAELAREIAMSHHRGQWRVAVVDDTGALTASLLTRRRPRHHMAGPPLTDGAPTPIVELHVTETELAALDPHAHPAWSAVLRDLQHQLHDWQQARAEDAAARTAEHAAEHATQHESGSAPASALDADALRRVADRRRTRAREALQRFPSAALRRWVEQRDRVCSFPPCGASATRCEIDHTLAVITGGITISTNLGPACSHDHRAKGPGGWTLRQVRPGRFTWTSPTGNDYPGRTPRIVPDLPEPLPPDQRGRSDPLPGEYADHGPLWHNDPYPRQPDPGPGPGPGPPADGPDDRYPEEPPF